MLYSAIMIEKDAIKLYTKLSSLPCDEQDSQKYTLLNNYERRSAFEDGSYLRHRFVGISKKKLLNKIKQTVTPGEPGTTNLYHKIGKLKISALYEFI